jgi:hypothetical protein
LLYYRVCLDVLHQIHQLGIAGVLSQLPPRGYGMSEHPETSALSINEAFFTI